MNTFALVINFIFLFHYSNAREDDATEIKINRKIENEGFHRYLTTDILFLKFITDSFNPFFPILSNNECNLLLIDNFDSNSYVDNYELKSKYYESMYTFILSDKVNSESAQYKARDFNLFLYIDRNVVKCYSSKNEKFKSELFASPAFNSSLFNHNLEQIDYFCSISIRLPIHVRYHMPASSGDYKNFTLKPPTLFATNCTNHIEENSEKFKLDNLNLSKLINSTEYPSTLIFPCQKGTKEKITGYVKQRTNDFLTKTFFKKNEIDIDYDYIDVGNMCIWNKLTFESLNKYENVKVKIPIGDTNHELLVLIITLMVVTFLVLKVAQCVWEFGNKYAKANFEETTTN